MTVVAQDSERGLRRLGVEEFTAAAIGNSWFNLFWCFLLGALTAIDTLASQAYGGVDYRSLLVWTISGFIAMTLYCIPLGVALFLSDHVAAVVFHQGHGDIADMVKQYCVALIPAMWLLVGSQVLLKYLQTQNSMSLPTVVMVVTAVSHVGLTYGYVRKWGLVGAAWAITSSQGVLFFLTLAAIWQQQHTAIRRASLTWRHWLPVSVDAAKRSFTPNILRQVIKLSLAGGAMTAFEGGAFEVTTMFAGAFGSSAVAAHAALVSLCIFIDDSMPLAVATAATIRVGNLLGCGLPKQAQLSGCLSIALGFILQGSAGIAIGASQGQVLRMFTSDPEVLEVAEQVVYYAMAFQFSNAIFVVGQGVLRGMGKQDECVWYNVIGFWACGVLIGWLLAFKAHLGLPGLWIGMLAGDVAAAMLTAIALLRSDWDKATQEAQAAMQQAGLLHAASILSRSASSRVTAYGSATLGVNSHLSRMASFMAITESVHRRQQATEHRVITDEDGIKRVVSCDVELEEKFFVRHPSEALPSLLSISASASAPSSLRQQRSDLHAPSSDSGESLQSSGDSGHQLVITE